MKGPTIVIGLLGNPKESKEMEGGLLEEGGECPLATQDAIVNRGNKQKAILTARYGPGDSKKKCAKCEYFEPAKEIKCGVEKGNGFCEVFEFVCAATNVCDAFELESKVEKDDSEDDSEESED